MGRMKEIVIMIEEGKSDAFIADKMNVSIEVIRSLKNIEG